MSTDYQEIRPPARLISTIECFWTMRHDGPETVHRVVPDACADILFTQHGAAAALEAVGAMTSYTDHPLREGQRMLGVRFRPGKWRAVLGIPGDRVTDAIVPLDALWGSRSRELLERLAESAMEEWPTLCERLLPRTECTSPIDRALAWMVDRRGMVSLDEVAGQAGISVRQFRRVCLQQTGLTPKFLARVLRFRHALARIGDCRGQFAGLALDCGYYDQAHLINDFRQLSGRTPASFGMAVFSNRAAGGPR